MMIAIFFLVGHIILENPRETNREISRAEGHICGLELVALPIAGLSSCVYIAVQQCKGRLDIFPFSLRSFG